MTHPFLDLSKGALLAALAPAVDAARRAGEAIEAVQASRTGRGIQRKDDGTPLTRADTRSHHIIDATLKTAWPDLPVVSEEGRNRDASADGLAWVVDPLDGTKEFISRTGDYVVNIGLFDNGTAALGIVHVPARGATFVGGEGLGAWRQAATGWTSIRPATDDGLRVVASRSHAGRRERAFTAALESAGHAVTRVPMGSARKFLAVAGGDADVYARFGPTMAWDTLAPQAIVEGAGCVMVGADGERFRYAAPGCRNGAFLSATSAAYATTSSVFQKIRRS